MQIAFAARPSLQGDLGKNKADWLVVVVGKTAVWCLIGTATLLTLNSRLGLHTI
jgi:hypothetical protein